MGGRDAYLQLQFDRARGVIDQTSITIAQLPWKHQVVVGCAHSHICIMATGTTARTNAHRVAIDSLLSTSARRQMRKLCKKEKIHLTETKLSNLKAQLVLSSKRHDN